MKVAFATSDMTHVNAHFGWTQHFLIYEVSPEGYHLAEARFLQPAGDDEDDKIQSRLNAILDCAMVYVASIGGTAAARVVKARIHPVKVKETETIDSILNNLVGVLKGNPPPWLRKLLHQGENSFVEA